MDYLLLKRNVYLLKGLLSLAFLFAFVGEFKNGFNLPDTLLIVSCTATMGFYLLFRAFKCEQLIILREKRIENKRIKREEVFVVEHPPSKKELLR